MAAPMAPAPPQRLAKNRLWPVLSYVPHKGQEQIHRSRARHRVGAAGRRFGKSVIAGHELTSEAVYTQGITETLKDAGKRREFWIVGPEYSDSEKEFRVFYNDLTRLEAPFDKPGTYNNPESGDMVVSLYGGLFIVHAKSAKYPATLVGEGLSGLVLAEAAKLKKSVWTKYLRPTLADFKGWSLWLSTPEGKNFFYDYWRMGQDPSNKTWESWRMPSWINRHVFPQGGSYAAVRTLLEAQAAGKLTPELMRKSGVDAEIIEMMMEMSEELFNQEVGADFSEYVGRVFKDWDEETHVTDLRYDPNLPLYGCCDYGWTNPFVWLVIQVDVWDNVYVIAEYRAERRDINDIASDLERWPLASSATQFYPDPAEPGDTAVLEKKLHCKGMGDTGGELKWRLELIRQHLKEQNQHLAEGHVDRKPKLFVDRRCVGLIGEMDAYRYPDNKSEIRANPEEPMDKDNHGPEALGRFFRGYFGGPQQPGEKGRAKVSRATVRR